MARLPIVGGDDGTWGTILNDYLSVSLAADGKIQSTAAATAVRTTSVKTATYSLSAVQGECILADASSGGFSIILPSAVNNKLSYVVKKIDTSLSQVTIGTTSSQTIDGSLTAPIRVPYASLEFVSDGSNWFIV